MRPTIQIRITVLFLGLLLLAVLPVAGGEPIAVLRIQSFDALKTDVDQVVQRVQGPEIGKQLMQPLTELLQFPGAELLDTRSPLVLVFPMEGMALGEKGFILAVPIRDPEGKLPGIIESSEGAQKDEAGVFSFKAGKKAEGAATIRGTHLLVGMNRDLVANFDLSSIQGIEDLPPGNIAVDINLVPLTPMIDAGLQTGRQAMQQQMTQAAQGEEGDGGEEGESAGPDPESIAAMVDFYFNFLQDLVHNTGRIQYSLELTQDHLLLHNRWLPRSGSTFEELLQGQKGGLPDLARLIDPEAGIGAMAGQFTMTPRFQAALQSFSQDYVKVMKGFLAAMPGAEGDAPAFAALMKAMEHSVDKWTSCYRGDFVANIGLGGDGGFHVEEIIGVSDPEACNSIVHTMATAFESLPKDSEKEPFISLTPGAFQYRGIDVTRQQTSFAVPGAPLTGGGPEEILNRLFGGNGLVAHYGITEKYMLTAIGKNSADRFKALADRLLDAPKAKAEISGLTEESFAPIRTGPGFFAVLDIESMFRAIVSLAGTEDVGDQAFLDLLDVAPEGTGRIVDGLRLDPDAARSTLAVRLDLLDLIGKMGELEKAGKPEKETAGNTATGEEKPTRAGNGSDL